MLHSDLLKMNKLQQGNHQYKIIVDDIQRSKWDFGSNLTDKDTVVTIKSLEESYSDLHKEC